MSLKNSSAKQMVIFGQRGVGKTSFLERLKSYWSEPGIVFLDLDQEIEKIKNKSVSEIFNQEGESLFRKYEFEVFEDLLNNYPRIVLTLGGGFPVSRVPNAVHCLWLQRASDDYGRIFLNRPRLNPEVSDIEEFFQRAKQREPEFEKRSDEIYLMPEGIRDLNVFERVLFADKIPFPEPTYLTLKPTILKQKQFLKKVAQSGLEFRDDLCEMSDFENLVQELNTQRIILSFRTPLKVENTEKDFLKFIAQFKSRVQSQCQNLWVDWALELGSPTKLKNIVPSILSLHDYLPDENLMRFLERLEAADLGQSHLKASPIISSMDELKQLWEWQREDPAHRSILPRSPTGKYAWFRLLMNTEQKINFWKISRGTALDQPTLYQWVSSTVRAAFSPSIGAASHARIFAAILGDPTKHSRTPIEQQDFFAKMGMPVLALDLNESEFLKAIPWLCTLGLKAAAVTSPLKRKAFELLQNDFKQRGQTLSFEFDSINTLYFSKERIAGTNTDDHGFQELAHGLDRNSKSVLIWGGGGTLPIVKKTFPNAIEFSVRTGKSREGDASMTSPEVVIWAAAPDADAPHFVDRVRCVLDLNYREDSMARDFAKKMKAEYRSGERMFLIQAIHQQKFWKTVLFKEETHESSE